jgi:hypothetical protein
LERTIPPSILSRADQIIESDGLSLRADTVAGGAGRGVGGALRCTNHRDIGGRIRGTALNRSVRHGCVWPAMTRRLIAIALVTLFTVPVAAQPTPSARETLTSFKALHSALGIGLNYDDYNRRLIDTKIKFDQYAERKAATVTDAKVKATISSAMDYHRLAQSAWTTKARTGEVRLFNFDAVKNDLCTRLRPLMADIERNWPDTDDRNVMVVEPWGDRLIPALWSCASDKINEAEKLLTGTK